MWKYAEHARSHADELVDTLVTFLESTGDDLDAVEAWYLSLDIDAVVACERKFAHEIADLIRRTPSQRPAAIRRLKKEHGDDIALLTLVLAVAGAVRAYLLARWRTNHEAALTPGRGYRVTTAGLYLAAVAASELFTDYSWPLDALDRADWNDAVKTHRLNWPDS